MYTISEMDAATIADACATKLSDEEVEEALWALGNHLPDEEQRVFEEVMAKLQGNTCYFSAPASSKFHLNCEGGLLRHSLGVTYRLWSLDGPYRLHPQYSYLDLFLVGLLHDLGKASQLTLVEEIDGPVVFSDRSFAAEEAEYYSKEFMKTKPGQVKYVRNKARVVMSVPVGSLHTIAVLLSDLWKPTPDAWQAVAYHDGQYVPEGRHVAQSESKLLLALHHADMYQCRYEGEWEQENWTP